MLGKYIVELYGEFILENVVLEDFGFYICVVNNVVGEDIYIVSLIVYVFFIFIEFFGDVLLNKGE